MAKWVYKFHEGSAAMRNLLGGKGCNLAEMTNLGMPIPQGFTVTTVASRFHRKFRTRFLRPLPGWKVSMARSLVIQRIRYWFPYVPAHAHPCLV